MKVRKGVATLTNEDKILEMLATMQGDIRQINTRLDSVETEVKAIRSDIVDMKESQEEVRTSVNAVLEWTETVSAVVPDIPKIS